MAESQTYAPSAGADSRPISGHVPTTTGNGNAAPSEGNLNNTMGGARISSMAEPAGYNRPVSMRTTEGRIMMGGGGGGPDMFVVGTFVLSCIGWLLVLVAQAYAAAKFANELVRLLWFGFVIQTILSVVILEVINGSNAYDAAYAYGVQISILSSLACVFAVLGADTTIYSSEASLKATGAGWLILSFVDLLWVIYFTSPPQSPVARLAMALGDLRGTKREEEAAYGKVERIGRSTDAFAMSPVPRGGSTQRVMSGVQPTPLTMQRHQQQQQQNESQNRPNANAMSQWSEPRTTVVSAQSDGAEGAATIAGTSDHEGGGSERQEGESVKNENEPKWKAEALFDYKGSSDDPNELSFKKGDILLIMDKSGKWWEAKTKNGNKGIVPSNYLRLL